MKIGLSFSACVADIVADRVKIEDVAVIVGNTKYDFNSSSDRLDAHKHLCVAHRECGEFPGITWTVLQQLWGRIIQPRLRDPQHGHKSEPHWIDVPSNY